MTRNNEQTTNKQRVSNPGSSFSLFPRLKDGGNNGDKRRTNDERTTKQRRTTNDEGPTNNERRADNNDGPTSAAASWQPSGPIARLDALCSQWLDQIGERNATERARIRVIHRANPDVQRMVRTEIEAARQRAAHPVKLEAA